MGRKGGGKDGGRTERGKEEIKALCVCACALHCRQLLPEGAQEIPEASWESLRAVTEKAGGDCGVRSSRFVVVGIELSIFCE